MMIRRFVILALLAGPLSGVQATVFPFNLTLDGASVVPPSSSTATAGVPSGEPGVSLDDGLHQLFLNVAWGDFVGFQDLQNSFLSVHIHGPTNAANETDILYELTTLANTQGPFDGAISQKALPLVDNPNGRGYSVAEQEAQLKAGLWYIDIHTQPLFLAHGEIRGQLVPVPEPGAYATIAGAGLLLYAARRGFSKDRGARRESGGSIR